MEVVVALCLRDGYMEQMFGVHGETITEFQLSFHSLNDEQCKVEHNVNYSNTRVFAGTDGIFCVTVLVLPFYRKENKDSSVGSKELIDGACTLLCYKPVPDMTRVTDVIASYA